MKKLLLIGLLVLSACNNKENLKYLGKWQEFNRVNIETGKNVNSKGYKYMACFKFDIQKNCIIEVVGFDWTNI